MYGGGGNFFYDEYVLIDFKNRICLSDVNGIIIDCVLKCEVL